MQQHIYRHMLDSRRQIRITRNIDELSEIAIEKWMEITELSIHERDLFAVALSGGKTPVTLYQKLSNCSTIPWDKTHIFMVDERFVPYVHEENNFRMINMTLLSRVPIPENNIHPIRTEHGSVIESVNQYESHVRDFFRLSGNELPVFDLILLGIGADGHTASLFPGSPSLSESAHIAIAVSPTDIAKKERITITLPVINNAKNIMFLSSGTEKAHAIKRILKEHDQGLPAGMVRPESGNVYYLLDRDACSMISDSSHR